MTLFAGKPLRRACSSIEKTPPDLAAEVGARHLTDLLILTASNHAYRGLAQERLRTIAARRRWRPFAWGLRQATKPAAWAFPPHEVGTTLTDGLRDFMINWAPRRITDEAGHERRQSFCWEVAAAQARTILREIGRS